MQNNLDFYFNILENAILIIKEYYIEYEGKPKGWEDGWNGECEVEWNVID